MEIINLPNKNKVLEPYQIKPYSNFNLPKELNFNREVFAAAHVVADPISTNKPWDEPVIDWDKTLSYREYLWSLGLCIAEAMDTAQRGMGLGWLQAKELIAKSLEIAQKKDNRVIFCGAGTDQLLFDKSLSLDDVIRAYEEQINYIQKLNGKLIIMASRALAKLAKKPADYKFVYQKIFSFIQEPVILHWLGDMFDPQLKGYWGSNDLDQAMKHCLEIIVENKAKIRGIKISLLDKNKEIVMRNCLPKEVKMYTGDDFNYAELIAGDKQGYSHALLGILDAIAPCAAAALVRLAENDIKNYYRILEPTIPLSRIIFEAPTRYYKTGIIFLAYLNGFQNHFTMIGGQESARSIIHLSNIFRLANGANLLIEPELALHKFKLILELHGIN